MGLLNGLLVCSVFAELSSTWMVGGSTGCCAVFSLVVAEGMADSRAEAKAAANNCGWSDSQNLTAHLAVPEH